MRFVAQKNLTTIRAVANLRSSKLLDHVVFLRDLANSHHLPSTLQVSINPTSSQRIDITSAMFKSATFRTTRALVHVCVVSCETAGHHLCICLFFFQHIRHALLARTSPPPRHRRTEQGGGCVVEAVRSEVGGPVHVVAVAVVVAKSVIEHRWWWWWWWW